MLVEYRSSQGINLGYVMSADARKFRILSQDGKEHSIEKSKVVFSSPPPQSGSLSREEIMELLRVAGGRREELKSGISLMDLWELVKDEDLEFAPDFLLETFFAKSGTFDEKAAFLRCLEEDHQFFRRRGNRFVTVSEDIVRQNIYRKSREDEKERRNALISSWINGLAAGADPSPPDEGAAFVEDLKSYVIKGEDAPHFKETRSILRNTAFSGRNQAVELLVRLGVFQEDENLLLLKNDIEEGFPEDTVFEAAEAVRKFSESVSEREDMSVHSAFSIDDRETEEVDDALSVRREGEILLVGVHIADPSHFVLPGSRLDETARSRFTSIYLPERKIPMLPPAISRTAASLSPHRETPCLSLLVRIGMSGEVESFRLAPGRIVLARRFSYDEAGDLMEVEEGLGLLHRLAMNLRDRRRKNGAVIFAQPDVEVRAGAGGKIELSTCDPEEPSHLLVSELMILANGLFARYLIENRLPAFFRTQEAPSENHLLGFERDPYRNYLQRRIMKRVSISATCAPHRGLGLEGYVQMTSPLRRYSDLVMHRQVRHALSSGQALYSEDELLSIVDYSRRMQELVPLIERETARYWLLKYSSRFQGREIPALILDITRKWCLLQMKDTLLETEAPLPVDKKLSPGSEVMVKIEAASPRDGILKVGILS
jgi:exoribonuclease-2